jgi:hypothetical protein
MRQGPSGCPKLTHFMGVPRFAFSSRSLRT